MVVEKKKKIKKTTVEKVEKKEIKKETKKKYIEAVGRRKASIARVRLVKDSPGFIINKKTLEEYFSLENSYNY